MARIYDDTEVRPAMVPITVRVPEPLLRAFKDLASREYDTASNRIRSLMREDVRTNGSEQP